MRSPVLNQDKRQGLYRFLTCKPLSGCVLHIHHFSTSCRCCPSCLNILPILAQWFFNRNGRAYAASGAAVKIARLLV